MLDSPDAELDELSNAFASNESWANNPRTVGA
jgi:hypothetical protein